MKFIKENKKMTREEVQNKALLLSQSNPFLILQYATGLGKSYSMIKILDNIFKNHKDYKCLILEPEIALKDNIKEEFIKFNKEQLLDNIDIICYKSFPKVEKQYDILVLDEGHKCISQLRQEAMREQSPKHIIILSATLTNNQIKIFENSFNCSFVIHKITLKQAIEWGILPQPEVIVFDLQLNNRDITCEYEFIRGKKDLRKEIICQQEKDKWQYIKNKSLYPNIHLIVKCTEFQKYNQLIYEAEKKKELYIKAEEELENFKKTYTGSSIEFDEEYDKKHNQFTYIKNNWLYSELCIKRFLSEIKTPYLDEFLKDAKYRRFIAFFGSVSQAKELAKINGGYAIYSEEKNSLKLIEKFNEGEIDNLYAVGMLQEGMNLKNIEIAIIAQLDGNTRGFLQKMGRGLRSELPEIYIFAFRDSKDEKYLKKALSNIDKDIVNHSDYFIF